MKRSLQMWCVVGVGLLAFAAGVRAEDSTALKERLHRADAESALDSDAVKPWHLRIAVQPYDKKGKPTADLETAEEWWESPTAIRIVYSKGGKTATEVTNATGKYVSPVADWDPAELRVLLQQEVHPFPPPAEIDLATPTSRNQKFFKVALECLMLSEPVPGPKEPPLGLFPTYCFDQGKDSLRISYDFGSEAIIRNVVGRFQGRNVATEMTLEENGLRAFTAKVTTLQTTPAGAAEAENVTDLTLATSKATLLSGAYLAGTVLEKLPPIYPESAKQRGVYGAVVLHAIIGRDGRIHSLRPVTTPDMDLTIAALAAVRQWRYKPYLIHGLPTEVDTTITVNFERR